MESASVPSNEHASTIGSNANSLSVRAKSFYDPGYIGPNYRALRVPLLREAKRKVQLIVDSHCSYWADTGCTIMVDGWTDTRHRRLINFLVYCPKGIVFIRSVDTFDLVKDAINMSNLLDEIVNWVGPANIIHLVTDNVANYVAIGRILCGKYRNISWSSCAAHCLNLIFKEIGKMDHVAKLAKLASKITVFIYNHVALQAWLRTRKNWTEIVRLGPTRDIHAAAAYWLNPAFQYDLSTLNKRLETQSIVTDVIESKVSVGRLKLVEELRLFREREQTFGTQLTQESAKTSQPDEWWKLFGSCAPTLQKFAIRILSQTVASSGCEQNWSVFEKIHSKIRNRLEHQQLNDLVYVHYNYRLKERVKRKKFNFDPIDYTSIDKTKFWVVEDEEPPFLDHEEIDNVLYEDGAYPIEEGSSSHVQRDMDNEVIEDNDDINLESFGDEDDAPLEFRDKNHPIPVEDEEDEDEDDDNDTSGGSLDSHDDIDFNFLHNK
ncbi:uncharacterized protein LOC142616308 [Castanea sativa]|uniref:uncharacterized protein LOC142616308 n=1 Tax=Castanea sativa TaxID=21020 RepID=UPI003F652206